MKEIARHILEHALRESSISQAFARQVHSERGVLRVCEDLYDLNACGRVFVISIGKGAHTMLAALHEQVGERFEGIVASSIEPKFHIRGFRYFHGGHPMPNAESIRAAGSMLKALNAQNESSLVMHLISGGGSGRNLSCPGPLRCSDRRNQCHSQAFVGDQRWTPGASCVSSAADFDSGF